MGISLPNWRGHPAYEVRCWSLSAIPTQILHLSVSQEVVVRAAQEEVGVDLAHGGGRVGVWAFAIRR